MESSEFKKRRERLGLSQVELAGLLGIASNTIWRYENDKNEIPKWMIFVFEALEQRKTDELKKPVSE